MLSARAEYGRVAEALRSHTRRNPGESARVDWISPSPLPRLFRSPAEVRERRETTHQSARVSGGRVHAESDRKIGTREPKLRAKTPFGVSVDGIDWPQPPPFRPSQPAPPSGPGVGGPVRLRGGSSSRPSGGRFVFACCAVAELTDDERDAIAGAVDPCLLYTSPSPRDRTRSRMPSSA